MSNHLSASAGPSAAPPRWHVGLFTEFWRAPRLDLPADQLAPDIRGYWPGHRQPHEGIPAYVAPLQRLLQLVPDFRLEVQAHATAGDVTFIRWIARGTWRDEPLDFDGVDVIRQRDGQVIENRIFCCHPLIAAILEEKAA